MRLDDEVWEAVKGMECSLNQYLRASLLDVSGATLEQHEPISAGGGVERIRRMSGQARGILNAGDDSAIQPYTEPVRVVDKRPKNCRCRHCGKPFAGPRFATLCPDCKSAGHTLSPAECPRCNEGSAI